MSYPVAYRKGSRGFQRLPNSNPRTRGPVRYLPSAVSNDSGSPIRQKVGRTAPYKIKPTRTSAIMPMVRRGARFLPYLGYAMTAYELYRLYEDIQVIGTVTTETLIVPPQSVGPAPAGWRRYNYCASVGPPYSGAYLSGTSTIYSSPPDSVYCKFGQAVGEIAYWGGSDRGIWARRDFNGSFRYAHLESWVSPSSGRFSESLPTHEIGTVEIVNPYGDVWTSGNDAASGLRNLPRWAAMRVPQAFPPDVLPLHKWAVPWEVLPQLRPHPNVDPSYGHESGPVTTNFNRPSNRTNSRQYPDIGGKPAPEHKYEPPKKGEKERKFKTARAVYDVMNKVVSPITEGIDFVNAGWDAMPDDIKKPKMPDYIRRQGADAMSKWRRSTYTPQYKLRKMYDNIDQLDGEQFIKNLVENFWEDFVLGMGSSYATKGSKPWLDQIERPVGLQTGPAF